MRMKGMRMMGIRSVAVSAVLGVAMVTSGCETTEGQGALIGAGGGALVGALACNGKSGSDYTECMALYTAGGAALGYAAGLYVKNQKSKYADAESFYTAEIDQTRAYNTSLTQYASLTQTEIDRLEVRLASLERQISEGQNVSASLQQAQAELDTLDKGLAEELASVENRIDTREQVLADIEHEIATSGSDYAAQKTALETEIAKLESARDTIAAQRTQVASQRTRVTS